MRSRPTPNLQPPWASERGCNRWNAVQARIQAALFVSTISRIRRRALFAYRVRRRPGGHRHPGGYAGPGGGPTGGSAAWSSETASLSAMADALKLYVVRSDAIPDQNQWYTAISSQLGLSTNQITTTPRNYSRAFLIDNGGWLGTPPWSPAPGPRLPPERQLSDRSQADDPFRRWRGLHSP